MENVQHFDLLSSGIIYGEGYQVVATQTLDQATLGMITSCVVEPRVNKNTGEVYEGYQVKILLTTGGAIYKQVSKNQTTAVGEVVEPTKLKFITLKKPTTNETTVRVEW